MHNLIYTFQSEFYKFLCVLQEYYFTTPFGFLTGENEENETATFDNYRLLLC